MADTKQVAPMKVNPNAPKINNADNQNKYNQLALELSQLEQQGMYGNRARIADIQKQMDALLPQVDPQLQQEYAWASNIDLNEFRQTIEKNLASGMDQQSLNVLGQNYKQAKDIIDRYNSVNQQIADWKKGASDYVSQQGQITTTQKTNAATIEDLQNKIKVGQLLGEDVSAEQAQLNKLAGANLGAKQGPKPIVTPPPKQPSVTPPPASSSQTPSAGTNTYTTVKGVLNYNGVPYTGQYNDKYYKNGKLETDAQVKADFLANYKEQAKFIMSIPELGGTGINGKPSLLDQAIQGNWSADRWIAEFQNSQWAQAHPGDVGLAEIKRISDPKQYAIDYNAAQSRLSAIANNLGVKLSDKQIGAQLTPDQMDKTMQIDQNAINNGQDIVNWLMQNPSATDTQIQQFIAKHGSVDPASEGGLIFQNAQQLNQIAKDYGVSGFFNPKNYSDYALNIAAGAPGYDLGTFANQQKQQAMQLYKPFANEIQNGATVTQLANPYINTLSNLLEVDSSNIDLGSTTGYGAMISKALMGDGTTATNPYDFAAQVRSRPEWLNTQNAHQTIMGGVDQLLSAFNFKGA